MERSFTYAELPAVAADLLKEVSSKILLFYGEMGVGKTSLIKEMATQMNAEGNLSSPTFSIVNEYALPADKIYHFDFYRLENEFEALDIGFEEYIDSGHWVFIEWPEKIKNLLPEDAEQIEITKDENEVRILKLLPIQKTI